MGFWGGAYLAEIEKKKSPVTSRRPTVPVPKPKPTVTSRRPSVFTQAPRAQPKPTVTNRRPTPVTRPTTPSGVPPVMNQRPSPTVTTRRPSLPPALTPYKSPYKTTRETGPKDPRVGVTRRPVTQTPRRSTVNSRQGNILKDTPKPTPTKFVPKPKTQVVVNSNPGDPSVQAKQAPVKTFVQPTSDTQRPGTRYGTQTTVNSDAGDPAVQAAQAPIITTQRIHPDGAPGIDTQVNSNPGDPGVQANQAPVITVNQRPPSNAQPTPYLGGGGTPPGTGTDFPSPTQPVSTDPRIQTPAQPTPTWPFDPGNGAGTGPIPNSEVPGFWPVNPGGEETYNKVNNAIQQNIDGADGSDPTGREGSTTTTTTTTNTSSGGTPPDFSGLLDAFYKYLEQQLGVGRDALNADYESRGVYESSDRLGAISDLEAFTAATKDYGAAQYDVAQQSYGTTTTTTAPDEAYYIEEEEEEEEVPYSTFLPPAAPPGMVRRGVR